MSRIVAIAAISLLVPILAGGAAQTPKDPEPTDAEIKAIVEQLVNPNPRPETAKEPRIRYPKDFDHEKERKVDAARRKLLDLGVRAFPHLFDRWDDDRYSLVTQNGTSGAFDTWDVGLVAHWIVFSQVQPYGYWAAGKKGDQFNVPNRPSYPHEFLGSKKDALGWWEKNKDKSLQRIQLDAIDWVIAEEAKKPKNYIDNERNLLGEIRADLTKSSKAMSPGNYYGSQFLPKKK